MSMKRSKDNIWGQTGRHSHSQKRMVTWHWHQLLLPELQSNRATSTWDDRSRQLLTSVLDTSRPAPFEYDDMTMPPPSPNMANFRAQPNISPGDASSALCSQKRMEAMTAARPRTTTNTSMKCARSCTTQEKQRDEALLQLGFATASVGGIYQHGQVLPVWKPGKKE